MKFNTQRYVLWNPWFAWYPVKVGTCVDEDKDIITTKWVCFEVVERKRRHSWSDWEYKEVTK